FRSGNFNILVATDVASRGIDVSDIKYVINYDFPRDIEDYVHRIGRTARGSRKGTAYSFFCNTDAPRASDLIKILRKVNQNVPEKLEELAKNAVQDTRRKNQYKRSVYNDLRYV
ncbi:putative ATP-dependent RNA helicase DDX17-like protein, partial [Leptotrombidium deliense]